MYIIWHYCVCACLYETLSMARDSTLLPLHRACTEGGFIPLLGCCEAAESTGHSDCQLSQYLVHKSVLYFLQVHCLPTCIVLLWLNHVVVWFLFRNKRILLPHWFRVCLSTLFTNQFCIFCKYIARLHVLFYCDWIMLWYGFCLGTKEYCYRIDSEYW